MDQAEGFCVPLGSLVLIRVGKSILLFSTP